MAVQSPYALPGTSPQVLSTITQNPTLNQNQDVGVSPLASGRLGELLVSDIHGKFGAMGSRGGAFLAATGTAATSIAVNTTTSASTFVAVNPVGSGKYMEFCRFKLDFLSTNAAPSTANQIGWSVVNLGANAISAITKTPDPVVAGGHPVNFGTTVPLTYVASVATFASAFTVAANWERAMFSFPASWVPTVGGYPIPQIYDFDGTLILPPGWAAALTASTAWAANTVSPALSWLEYFV